MKKTLFLIFIAAITFAQTNTTTIPFSNEEEGNNFREWINVVYPKYAKKINLGKEGSYNNSYITKAYNKHGEEYNKLINPAPDPVIDVLTIGEKINGDIIKRHIAILASDAFEGREVGERGEELAAQYMSNYFSKIGIPPYKNSTYYQEFKLGKRNFKNINIEISGVQYELKKDFYISLQ